MNGAWDEVGDAIWVGNFESLDLNVGMVGGDGGLLVIDTRADHAQGEELRSDLRRLSPLPVSWVVNTHYHWDHTWGNAMFRDSAIWGHVQCAAELRENGDLHKLRLMEEWDVYADRFAAVEIVPPEHTFEDEASIDIGTRRVELRYLGLGHTNSDIVISVDGVTFAGDLIENGAPPAFGDSFPLEWPAAVAALVELVDGPVVPGHGDVADRAFVAAQHADLAEVARLAADHHRFGIPLEDAPTDGPYPPQAMRDAFDRVYEQLGR